MRKLLITQKRRGLWAGLTALLLAVVMTASPQMTAQVKTNHQQLQVNSNSMQFDVQKFDNMLQGVIFISQLYNDGRFDVQPADERYVFNISLKNGGNVESIVNDLYNNAAGDFATMDKMALSAACKDAKAAMPEELYYNINTFYAVGKPIVGGSKSGIVDDNPLPGNEDASSTMKYYPTTYDGAYSGYDGYWHYDVMGIHNGHEIETSYYQMGYVGRINVDGTDYIMNNENLGQVYEYSGIQIKHNVSMIDNGQVVKFGYTICNNTNVIKNVKIGNFTDVKIGDNDGALVHLTDGRQKISMTDTHSAGSCTSAGLEYTITSDENTPFTGAWIGNWSYAPDNVFGNVGNTEYNGDSGCAFHWVRTLQPGQTSTMWCYFQIAPALVIKSVNLTADAETSQVHFDIPYKDFPYRTQTLYYVLQPEDGEPEEWKTKDGNTTPGSPEDIDDEGFVHTSFTFSADVTEWPSNTMRYIDLYAIDNMGYRSKDYHFEVWWPEWVPQQTYSTVYFKNTVKNFADIHGLIGEIITLPIDESDDPGMVFKGWNDKADGSGNGYAGGANFTIPDSDITLYAQWQISPDALTYINEDQYYTGQEIREIKVKYGTTTWEEGIDYNITYTNNINVGQASATITSDKLTTSKTIHFNIMKATNQWVTTPSVANVPLGTEVEPVSEAMFGTATVTYEGISGTEYASSTTKPTAAGYYKATFTVAETTNYSPELTVTDVNFTIYVAEVLSGTTVLGAYPTVQDAINAAENGNTVRIGCDIAENIIVNRTDMTITLDLNGKTLRPSKYEKPSPTEDYAFLITVKTPLIIDDSSEGKTGLITTGGTEFKTGGVYATANITLNNGTITTSRTGTVFSNGGGVYVQTGSTFTMNGGAITGCYAIPGEEQITNGGGVYINDGASFVMNDGIISNNSSDKGGGVSFNGGNRTFTMTGGTITGNTTAKNIGGGVYMWGATGIVFNVGGTAKIYGNTGNNVYLDNNATMTVNTAFAEGAQIYVTTSTIPTSVSPVPVTSNGTASDVKYFKSDKAEYTTIYKDNKVKLAIKGDYVCQIVETGVLYTTVQAGVDATTATNKTVQMINNSNENVTVASGKTVILDLNGFVLKGKAPEPSKSGPYYSVISINANANMTLTDSGSSTTIHYYSVAESGLWTWIENPTSEQISGALAYETLGAYPATGTVVALKGGAITGGSQFNAGGGICDYGTLIMNGGNIIGNTVQEYGGGVCVCSDCTNPTGQMTMHGGIICGNISVADNGAGGGICTFTECGSILNMDGGDVSFNTSAVGYGGGGINIGNQATITGGKVTHNKSIVGGVYINANEVTLGGSFVVEDNTLMNGTTVNNVYLPTGVTVTISSVTAFNDAASIGITTQATPAVGSPVAITSNGSTSDMAYFVSDNEAYVINYDTDHLVLAVPTCYLYDGDTFVAGFNSVQKAIDAAAGDSIVMLINSNENVLFPEEKTYVLNLNGCVLKGTGDGCVICNEGTLIITDSNSAAVHKFTPDAEGLWVLDETSGTKTVNGGCITNGYSDGFGGGIYNYGTLTMNGGNVVGNKSTTSGGGIYTGLYDSEGSAFTMNGGNIFGNHAENYGGGVSVNNICVVKLLGGNIKYNVGTYGGGVESGWKATNPYTLGGNIVITDNTSLDGTTPNNLYIYSGYTCTISGDKPLTESASIGVNTPNAPTATAPVPLTSNGTAADKEHFSSDNGHSVNYAINHIELSAPFVCELYDTNHTTLLARFSCVQSAVNMATSGQLVKMIDNSEESVRVSAQNDSEYTLTLDLNGCVLDASIAPSKAYIARPTISVYNHVVLNIIDSNPNAAHYFTVEETTIDSYTAQKWTLNTTATEGTDWTTLTARPAVNDIIKVKGGIITGGDAFIGGGIDNKGTVNMSAGAIVGNVARNFGGGINTRSFSIGIPAATNLSGTAAVLGNWSVDGGGICAGGDSDNTGNGDITMTGNSRISFNTSAGDGGGLWMIRNASIYGNSKINYNTAATDGGGIYYEEAKKSTAGSLTIGNTIAVKDNIGNGDKTRNLFLDGDVMVTVGTGDYALADDVVISVSVAKYGNKTTAANVDNTKYFTSENPAHGVYNNGKDDNQHVYIGIPVAYIAADNLYFSSVQDAVDAASAGQTVKMLANSTENVTIAAGKDVTLDLNDCVLTAKANCVDATTSPKVYLNRAILVKEGAKLVIKDASVTKTTRYITKDKSDPTLTYKYMVTETPTDSIVTGGLIVGGWANVNGEDGAGVLNLGTFTMNGGTIAGCACVNTTTGDGAGVCNKGVFTMTAGELCYNTAMISGGGLCNKGANTVTATITGGKIHHNITVKKMSGYSISLIGIGGGIANLESAILTLGSDSPTQEDDVEINNNSTYTSNDNSGLGGGGIANASTLTIKAGVSIHDNVGMTGGGIVSSGTVTMSGGKIYGNNGMEGGGVCNAYFTNNNAEFTMTGGKIYNNVGYIGGGLLNYGVSDPDKTITTIIGGEITGNTAGLCGGILNFGKMTIGGNVKITGNTQTGLNKAKDVITSNLVIYSENSSNKGNGLFGKFKPSKTSITMDFRITISTEHPLVNATPIGVSIIDSETMSYISGKFTTPCDASNKNFFVSDGTYEVNYCDNCLVLGNPVAYVVETNYYYDAVQEAINAAEDGKTVRLIKNVTENVTVTGSQVVTLDLNGFVFSGTGTQPVITNNGTLTLTDSNLTAVHKFTPNAEGLWVLNETSGTVTVNGGCITGGYNNTGNHGAGIRSVGILTMNGGNVIGNKSTTSGGGIYVGSYDDSSSAFTMNGGNIFGNRAEDYGGGVSVNYYCVVKLLGGNIKYNKATYGGGVESGWDGNNPYTLGGNIVITDNTSLDGTTPNNLYVYENYTFSVGTGDDVPASGMMVHVTPFKWESGCIIPISTANGTNDYSQYFKSDNEVNHFVVYTDKEDNNRLKITDDVKVILTVNPEGVAEVKIFNATTGLEIADPTHIHYGTMVTIKVMSTDPDWTFKGWYNNDGTLFSGKYQYTFMATQNLNLEARFTDEVIWVRVKK